MEESASRKRRLLLQQLLTQFPRFRISKVTEREIPTQATEQGQPSTVPKSSSLLSITSSSLPSPSFHKFISLPTELRLQIWELALFSPPRVVDIIEAFIYKPNSKETPKFYNLFFSAGIPSGLQICRETRSLALPHYLFTTGNVKLYVGPEDTLYFGARCSPPSMEIFARSALEADLSRLKRVALHETTLKILRGPMRAYLKTRSYCGPMFRLFSGRSQLVIVFDETGEAGRYLWDQLYEERCLMCQKLKSSHILNGWNSPDYSQYVSKVLSGVFDKHSEDAYRRALVAPSWAVFLWMWEYVHDGLVSMNQVNASIRGRVRVGSVAELHRFIDVKAE